MPELPLPIETPPAAADSTTPVQPAPPEAQGVDADKLSKASSITLALLVLNVLWFCVSLLLGSSLLDPGIKPLVRSGASVGLLATGSEPWRLISSMFLHIGLLHLFVNMLCLYTIGFFIQSLFGRLGYLAIYFFSGIGGSLASIAWNPAVVGAGASGAIFGLIGAIGGLMTVRKCDLNPEFVKKQTRSVTAFVGYNLLFGFMVPGIDNLAHLGGLATGWLCGMACSGLLGNARWRPAQFAGLLGVLIVLGGMFGLARSRANASPAAHVTALITTANRLEALGSEIFYSGAATRQDAEQLAAGLKATHFAAPDRHASLLLRRDADGLAVSFTLKPEFIHDEATHAEYRKFGGVLSEKYFNRQPLTILLCDGDFTPGQTLRIVPRNEEPDEDAPAQRRGNFDL